MKKLSALVASLLILGCAVYADVSVKDLGGGKAEVTFFYGNPRATEVVVAGDFTNWQTGALPMTKVEKGWEFKTTVTTDTVMKYKFISDGNWTADLKAPDTIDDGFGGKNGLVVVADLLAKAPAAASATAAAGDGAAAAAPAKTAKIKYQTWSHFGGQAKFNTLDSASEKLDSAGVNLKSYWKFSGEAVPDVPVYVEIALAEQDGFNNLYKAGTTTWENGAKNLFVDTIFDPVYYYGGQSSAATYLGHFKSGLTTKYVEWTTGYKYAKLAPHTNVSWITVDKEWEAGYSQTGGFNAFSLGQELRQIGDVTINATIAPNRSADRAGNQYGLYSFVNAQYGKQYLDFQYNGAYGKTYDTIFDQIYEADFIGGYSGSFGPLGVKANALYNVWGANVVSSAMKTKYSPASTDVSSVDESAPATDNLAANVQLAYNSDIATVTVGYRLRGAQANMMYVEDGGSDDHTNISDQLGSLNTQRVWIDASVKPVDFLTLGLNPYANLVFSKADYAAYAASQKPYADKDNIELYVKPSVAVALKDLAGIDATVSGYGKVSYATAESCKYLRGTNSSAAVFSEAGLKFSANEIGGPVKGIDVYYGFDNNDANMLFNTLLAQVKLPEAIAVQAGFGLRANNAGYTGTASATNAPFGLFAGVTKKLSILQKPIFYAQVVYNMDPYKGFNDGQDQFNLDGSILAANKSGTTKTYAVNDYLGNAAIRVGLGWDL